METIYLSLVHTGSCEYLFHEIPGTIMTSMGVRQKNPDPIAFQ